jgi:ABC-type uncharacterized transport system involved in gliding motility auxiliary subunit
MKHYFEEWQKKLGRARFEDLTTTAGILIVLGIVILINLIAKTVPIRFDLTEHNFYTLSSGTKQILRELDTPVKIRFYATDDRDAMSADERNFAQSVRDRLLEFKKIGGRNVVFEQLNPEPDTNAEDAAELDGLQPLQGQLGPIYLGVVVSCIDKKEVIAALDPRREELLEYDVINAVSRVYRDEKPKVKIMTGLNLAGGFSGNFQAPPAEPWFIYSQLKDDYDLEVIPTSSETIDTNTDVLVVMHPYDISESGEYAIDQYLLQGGTVLALVDPLFYAARFMSSRPNPMMGGMQPPEGPAPSSDLPTLFDAWGVEYQSSQVMADANYQTDIEPPRGRYLPTLLSLSQDAINENNVVTSQLTDVYLPFAGAFKVSDPSGFTVEPLISASENNKLVASFEAEPQSMDELRKSFLPTGEKDWHYAVRLNGTFKTAFPNGDPNAKEEETEDLESDEGSTGAAPAKPEAAPAKPEAAPAKPEAAPAKPEAAPAKPEAAPAKPEAAPAKPEAAPAKPEAAPAKPEAAPAKPEAAPAKPEAAPAKPEAAPAKPEAAPAKPEAAKKEAGGEGAPESKDAESEDGDKKEESQKPASLKESAKPGTVVLVSDVDFIYDRFAVQILNLGPGFRAAQPINQNLSFVQNLVEVLGGDERLISVRSRQSSRRPFTLLNRMQAQAHAKMRARIEALESKEREIGEKLQAALKVEETASGQQQIIIDQSKIDQGAIDSLRQEQVSARQDLRDARKELKKRQDSFINWLKAVNIGLMPILITAVGFYFFHRRQKGLEAR